MTPAERTALAAYLAQGLTPDAGEPTMHNVWSRPALQQEIKRLLGAWEGVKQVITIRDTTVSAETREGEGQ